MNNGLLMKYFVLNPTKNDAYGKASRKAMKAYAVSIFDENEGLAKDLVQWIESLEGGLPKKKK